MCYRQNWEHKYISTLYPCSHLSSVWLYESDEFYNSNTDETQSIAHAPTTTTTTTPFFSL